tara:strand:- start:6707 stop:7621 length:915 start_codon:yes stop_codon:yes gene_type:complete
MAVTLQIKRRAASGSAGAPAALKSGEICFNEVSSDNNLYYGFGDDGSANATSIIAIGGAGSFTTLSTTQTIDGDKSFTGTVNLGSATLQGVTTSAVGEGSNLYYTDARSRAAVSSTSATGIAYNSTSGVFSLASIPNTSLTNSSFTINGGTVNLGGAITVQGTTNEVDVSTTGTTVTVGLPNDVTIANDLVVSNNLTVNGTLTTISTSEVRVEDKNILLGDTSTPTDTTADSGGITLAGATSKTIQWLQATGSWTFNQPINIVNSGTFQIGGTQVLNASRVMSNVAITGSGNTIDNVVLDAGTF